MTIDRDAPLTTEEIVERMAWKLCFQENEVWEEAPASYHVRWRREAAQMLVSGADRIVEALSAREATEGGEAVAWLGTNLDGESEVFMHQRHAEFWANGAGRAEPLYTHPSPSKPVEGEPTALVGPTGAQIDVAAEAIAALTRQCLEVDVSPSNYEIAHAALKAALRSSPAPQSEVAVKPWELVHEYAQNYEWRGDEGDYTPTEAERAMIEDAIHGFLGEVEDAGALVPSASKPGEPTAQVEALARWFNALPDGGMGKEHFDALLAIVRSASIPPSGVAVKPLSIIYTNWRGETAERTILPLRMWFGSTEWHPEPQWLLTAIDTEKNAERDLAWWGIDFQGGVAEARAKALEEAAGVVENMQIYVDRDEGIGPAGRSRKPATFEDAAAAIRALSKEAE